MQAIRLCTREFPGIDGVGGERLGGRWNSPGRPVVYTSSCGALAALEYLAHVTKFPKNMWMVRIEVPDTSRLREGQITAGGHKRLSAIGRRVARRK